MTSSYNDLVNVASFGKKREYFDTERGNIAHYCRDCKKNVDVEVLNEELAKFRCLVCSGVHIATGTAVSLQEHYSKKR
ncbi:MAG: hypothetical protein PHU93_00565 [Candidatus Gracilibacteria bacterium]|nr:hypothetical protein [Candidatus Gracilibacteria bacterium]